MDNAMMITAAKQPALSTFSNEDALAKLVDIVMRLYMVKGLNPDKTMIRFTANEVLRKIIVDFPKITPEEVGIACDKGVYGEFDMSVTPCYTVNAQTIIGWCKSYILCEERQTAIGLYYAAQRKGLPPALPPMSKDEMLKGQVKRYWQEARSEGSIFGFAHQKAKVYDYLVGQLLIKDDDASKKEAFERAKELLSYHEEMDKTSQTVKATIRPIKGVTDGYMLTMGADSPKIAVINVAKSILLEKNLKTMTECPVQ